MRKDIEVQEAVRQMFVGVAPERAGDLQELWDKYNPRFNILPDMGPEGNFIFDAGAYVDVRFNHRALRVFWLASFIAWEAFRAVQESDQNGSTNLVRFHEMLMSFKALLENQDEHVDLPLPDGVPDPGHFPAVDESADRRAAAELAIFAAGWGLLHEVRHIKHQQDGTGATPGDPPEKFWEEEFSCDEFATEFLLGKIGEYADSKNVNEAHVRQQSVGGIYMALFAMTLLTSGKWEACETHPAVEDRIKAVMKRMGSNIDENSFVLAHDAFSALGAVQTGAPNPFLQG
ncbi:MAG: hypothetical protein HRU33_23585 [Rhodobacteraceae bacterium]|nr:hypothetical protein [Paracoccaceae bacterium]